MKRFNLPLILLSIILICDIQCFVKDNSDSITTKTGEIFGDRGAENIERFISKSLTIAEHDISS
jgi:hypothetical protein